MNLNNELDNQEKNIRSKIISQIKAFAGDYSHSIEGRDVIIVEQLLDFLES